MSDDPAPEVPVYENRASRDEAYYAAKGSGEPFLAVERYEEGYAVTYDLLTAGCELTEPAQAEIDERTRRAVEDVVADDAAPTTEVGRSLGPSLGQISLFREEATARRVAATVAETVLDESNWAEATPPDAGEDRDPRRN
ncbi:MAG: hypothetical protein ABEJ40_04865 [Haloarculaceae archaeon]